MAYMGWHMRKPQGYRKEASEQMLCLFVLCLPYYQSLLFAGMSGMISFLLLTLLLMFVVARSPAIGRVVIARLKLLPPSWLVPAQSPNSRWVREPLFAVGPQPTLTPLSQRPPPLFS